MIGLLLVLSSVSLAASTQMLSIEKEWLNTEKSFISSKLSVPDEVKDLTEYLKDVTTLYKQANALNVFIYCNKYDVSVSDIVKYISIDKSLRPVAGKVYSCIDGYKKYYDKNDLSYISTLDNSLYSTNDYIDMIEYSLTNNPTLFHLKNTALGDYKSFEDAFLIYALNDEKNGKYYDAVDTYARLLTLEIKMDGSYRAIVASLLVNMDDSAIQTFVITKACLESMKDDPGYDKDPTDNKKNRFEKIEELTRPVSYRKGIPCVDEQIDKGLKAAGILRYKMLRIGIRSSLIAYILKQSQGSMDVILYDLQEYEDLLIGTQILNKRYIDQATIDPVLFKKMPIVEKIVILTQHMNYLAKNNFKIINFADVHGVVNCGYGFVVGIGESFKTKSGVGLFIAGSAMAVIGGPITLAIGTTAFVASSLFSAGLNYYDYSLRYDELSQTEKTEKVCQIALDVAMAAQIAHGGIKGYKDVKAFELENGISKVDTFFNKNKIAKAFIPEKAAKALTTDVRQMVKKITSEKPTGALTSIEEATAIESALSKSEQPPLEIYVENVPDAIKEPLRENLDVAGIGKKHCSPIACLTTGSPERTAVEEVVNDLQEGYENAKKKFDQRKKALLDDYEKQVIETRTKQKTIENTIDLIDDAYQKGDYNKVDIPPDAYYKRRNDLALQYKELSNSIEDTRLQNVKTIKEAQAVLKSVDPKKPISIHEQRTDKGLMRALGNKANTADAFYTELFFEYTSSDRVSGAVADFANSRISSNTRYSVYPEEAVTYIEQEAENAGFTLGDGFQKELETPKLPQQLHQAIVHDIVSIQKLPLSAADFDAMKLVDRIRLSDDAYLQVYDLNGKKTSVVIRKGQITTKEFEAQKLRATQGIEPTPLADNLIQLDNGQVIVEEYLQGKKQRDLITANNPEDRKIALANEVDTSAAEALAKLDKKIHEATFEDDGTLLHDTKAAENERINTDKKEARTLTTKEADWQRVSATEYYYKRLQKMWGELSYDAVQKYLEVMVDDVDKKYEEQPSITIVDNIPEGAAISADINAVLTEGYKTTKKTQNSNGLSMAYAVRETARKNGNPILVSLIDKFFQKRDKTIKGVDLNPNFGKRVSRSYERTDIEYRNLFVDADANSPATLAERIRKTNTQLEEEGSSFYIDDGKVSETRIGLALEAEGKLKGPIRRDHRVPPTSGHAEFIDTNGQLWDVKGYRDVDTNGNLFSLDKAVTAVKNGALKSENTVLDVSRLNPENIQKLYEAVNDDGFSENVLWYNPAP